MVDEIERWEKKDGVKSLEKIGVKEGNKVLDFGCGSGHYTIPAARAVGRGGKVYAVDMRENPLSVIRNKASKEELNNIEVIRNSGGADLNFKDCSMDNVLLFDILHYFDRGGRKRLYRGIKRVLKEGKVLTVYPKHTVDDHPHGELKDMEKEDIVEEIKQEGLCFEEKICVPLSHNERVVEDCVFNFAKMPTD